MKKQEIEKAGDHFEYLASAIFQSQGFLIRRAVPLQLNAGTDATDIDVLGIKFVYPFQPLTLICDCKDRTRPQAHERLIWAKGLGSILRATDVYVATRRAKLETVRFAAQNGVRVLTDEVIQEFSAQGTVDIAAAYSHAKADTAVPLLVRVSKGAASDRELKEALWGSIGAFQHVDAFEDLNYSLSGIRRCSTILQALGGSDSDVRFGWAYVLANFVVAFSVHLLHICAETLTLSKSDRRTYIFERLTYGALGHAMATSLVDATLEFARSSYGMAASAQGLSKPRAKDMFHAPEYADDIVGLVERAIRSPRMYHNLPQALDYILFDSGLVNAKFEAQSFYRTFPTLQGTDVLKATRNVFAFLRSHSHFVTRMIISSAEFLGEAHLDPELPQQASEGSNTEPSGGHFENGRASGGRSNYAPPTIPNQKVSEPPTTPYEGVRKEGETTSELKGEDPQDELFNVEQDHQKQGL